jgi:hypothetical protein
MLTSMKNRLLDVVRAHADASLFESHESTYGSGDQTAYCFTISVKNSRLVFNVSHPNRSFTEFKCNHSTFTPGFYLHHVLFDYKADIDFVISHLNAWLANHVTPYLEELNLPDQWQLLKEEPALFGTTAIQPGDLERFNEEEKTQARSAILEFERRIQVEFKPTAEQAEVISAQLRYLSSALDRMNRFDWRSILLSTVIGITTTLSMDTETGRRLFEIAKQIFAEAIKYLPG